MWVMTSRFSGGYHPPKTFPNTSLSAIASSRRRIKRSEAICTRASSLYHQPSAINLHSTPTPLSPAPAFWSPPGPWRFSPRNRQQRQPRECSGATNFPARFFRSASKIEIPKHVNIHPCPFLRRKFHEALEPSPRTASWILRQIQHLYRIEARLRENGLGPQLRVAIRCAESKPIVERVRRALIRLKSGGRYLPKSLLGIAMDYALGQWPTLEIFLQDGKVEIDNNLVENAIRPTALGKKNWLFMGDADAGERGAVIYTVVESCRRRGIDPYAYLKDVLTRLPKMTNHQVPEIVPAAWAKTHLQVLRQAAL
jgi:hypothetical protein